MIFGSLIPDAGKLRARITALEALVSEAREVVKPFALAATDWIEMGDSRPINAQFVTREGYPITVGELRRAAALSTKLEQAETK